MLGLALVFSILQPLEDAVRWLLERFHYDLGVTWAWAIVGTTIVVRILLVPLTVRQIHSMQSLQQHAPEMKEIQRKYKGDRQKMNEEMMRFYKENHINPAASCLPLLAQAPVFISLYLVLKNFSKHVPPGSDLSWLHFVPDITAKANSNWSGYVLLAVYAGSQILSTYFMSTAMDEAQRRTMRIMMFVPLIFLTVIAHFPAGLVIYWVTTNLWTVGQGLVTRRLVPRTKVALAPTPKRSSRAPSTQQQAVADTDTDTDTDTDGSAGNGAKVTPPAPKPKPAPTTPRRVKRNRGHGRR
jgi:YidC/Oxa1 family membrane protein insertase